MIVVTTCEILFSGEVVEVLEVPQVAELVEVVVVVVEVVDVVAERDDDGAGDDQVVELVGSVVADERDDGDVQ